MNLVEVTITENENILLNMIKEFRQTCAECPTKKPVRVVGGWVRDRLLGIRSHDIDIALEDCTGEKFAHQFESWLRGREEVGAGLIRTIVVKANPEKSKHLETAMMSISSLNMEVDFVNLRSESYANDSRIPNTIHFGTPAEDAYRRDLTINALFYNVDTKQIEDFTGVGMNDLRQGILRTPLDPVQTFMDDPLRVIRVVRFASKLPNTRCHDSVYQACNHSQVKLAIQQKITKERIRQELIKVFEYPSCLRAFELMHEWDLWQYVLLPTEHNFVAHRCAEICTNICAAYNGVYHPVELLNEWSQFPIYVERFMESVIRQDSRHDLLSKESGFYSKPYRSFEKKGVILMTSLLLNHFGYKCQVKNLCLSATEDMLITLKSKNVATQVAVLSSIVEEWCVILQKCESAEPSREQLIRVLRAGGSDRYWEFALIIAVLARVFKRDILPTLGPARQVCANNRQRQLATLKSNTYDQAVQKILGIKQLVYNKYQLQGLWSMTPLLNGNEVMALLPPGTPSRVIGTYMGYQLDWIAAHWSPNEATRLNFVPALKDYLKNLPN
ncbi:putative tRNA nucleotidyltransferase [Gregarina niphandrodes]|uniref:tRNA nucleotidyltransferase n=1 Tax=Gregarina niphandrodes TaxID=110365 RepID=A0A023BC60_GRENI|nr:putative tRNA nucleotidyltransferase [Gregarina niphandrodes]EZG82421.1 putative tRNA nucleotidyltransferase [Gregarina niphandrodes]|eukprot:XP_011128990.1 putative tRNA nucleotidyltransferase [Gregarina niphandrodes]